eukprot:TRINITY_DN55199_c0_g1_i1.p1 TRINITY_DN55199_c0_g1~~TRINITY_DN55199_c0_g1_i1.p1  ORF type:complete len:574 (+),score=87.75 TRINITY_DN55199_c0_g1_i1:172-1893(+)
MPRPWLVACAIASLAAAIQQAHHFDLVVYDATSGGIAAAVSAARSNLSVGLLCASWPGCFEEGGFVVGGMSSGGLGQTDIGSTFPYLGGFAREFYARNRAHYAPNLTSGMSSGSSCRLPSPSCNVTYNLEPKVAQQIFTSMLAEANVTVFFASQVRSVTKQSSDPTRIASVDATTGQTFSASVFIDASYEGDLLQKAGASYSVGREPRSAFNESLAGITFGAGSNQFSVAVDPFNHTTGEPLPFAMAPSHIPPVGSGDQLVQAYNFRLCVTKAAANRVRFARPEGYDPSRWELLRRYLEACGRDDGCQLGFPSCNTQPIPGEMKFDMNNCGGFSSDLIGGSWSYPEASYQTRRTIWTEHLQYQQGLLYFMQSDPAAPEPVREAMREWGLCGDEFETNRLAAHWPPALYVRAARRLQGDRVFDQNTPNEQHRAGGIDDSIGIGGYNFDSHNAQRLACLSAEDCFGASHAPHGTAPDQPFAWDEGDVEIAPGLYQIPYWVLLPKRTEVTNLLVVATPSASHIGMSTLRMEPQEMILGQAAGLAAGLTSGLAVQDVTISRLTAALRFAGAVLDLPA